MTRITVRNIIWDAWNIEHIRKHRVSKEEVIDVVEHIIYHKRTYGGRYLVIGRTNGRIIGVVVQRKKAHEYYIVTARDTDKKERRRVYEKEKSK